jgi:hypothetical protein
LEYPACLRCRRTNKDCHYAYPPQLFAGDKDTRPTYSSLVDDPKLNPIVVFEAHHEDDKQIELFGKLLWQLTQQLENPHPSQWLGQLGQVAPLIGDTGGTWVLRTIREFPTTFAMRAETPFIHKSLYPNSVFPKQLHAEFGICGSLRQPKRL